MCRLAWVFFSVLRPRHRSYAEQSIGASCKAPSSVALIKPAVAVGGVQHLGFSQCCAPLLDHFIPKRQKMWWGKMTDEVGRSLKHLVTELRGSWVCVCEGSTHTHASSIHPILSSSDRRKNSGWTRRRGPHAQLASAPLSSCHTSRPPRMDRKCDPEVVLAKQVTCPRQQIQTQLLAQQPTSI
jgi:hypothetical protein